ncbi:MAG: hypothetical protein M9894_04745 [Planctomycetes bacterium]|nr:hypothetical protein [Planctomycetota bacterium]
MSDAALRDLERRWRASRALADEVAWLAERLRAGVVERDQVHLAAYLGDEASVRVCAGVDLARWMAEVGVIEPGVGVGPLRLGVLVDRDGPLVTRSRVEVREGCVVHHARNLRVFVDATTGLVSQVIAGGRFEGAFLGRIRVGTTLRDVVRVAGPIEEDEEDNLVLRDHPGLVVEADGLAPESRVVALGVFRA